MNNIKKIICISPTILLFVFIIYLNQPGKVLAASVDTFSFSFEGQNYAVSAKELSGWRGRQIVESANIYSPPAENIETSIKKILGQQTLIKKPSQTYNYTLAPIYLYLQNLASSTIDTQISEPKLKIENNRAIEFTPPQNGRKTDVYKNALDALDALELHKEGLALTVIETKPNTSLGQSNDLGINELIAQGVSKFTGSPKNRRHNISVGVGKFKGLIIAQGEEFSFNKNLGPVEEEQGFLPELVIKKEGTIPEFGGGLCQVSTTTFRGAMEAGLPITQRRNHAYAVQYYSPQGTDATIYPGSSDLKFINDTPGAILIWPHIEPKETLVFDFYGTKDSRHVTLEKPVVYDRKEDGSMKATWTREVVAADGKLRTDIFKSIYQSPALFHKTEQFVSNTSTPSSLQAPKTN